MECRRDAVHLDENKVFIAEGNLSLQQGQSPHGRVAVVNSSYSFANTNYCSTCASKFQWSQIKFPGNTQHCATTPQYHVFQQPPLNLHAEARPQPSCIVQNRRGHSREAGLSCILQHPEMPLQHPNTSHPFLLDFVPPEWSKEALKASKQTKY